MKQIYNFEATNPPVCNETMLKEELKKRQTMTLLHLTNTNT